MHYINWNVCLKEQFSVGWWSGLLSVFPTYGQVREGDIKLLLQSVSLFNRTLHCKTIIIALFTVRQALEGFPDGLPALTPKGVKLSLDQILSKWDP